MASPKPWSYTALDTFCTCPRQYRAKYVLKSVREPETEAMRWGSEVHKHFENRQAVAKPLPPELAAHEPFMVKLEERPGVAFTEMKCGIDNKLKPCNFFDKDVWCRIIKDFEKVDGANSLIIDYKTGKPHQKPEQLALFALHTFIMHPQVNLVNAQYYWTQSASTTKKVWSRSEVPALWGYFMPDLKQYVEAYQTDIWQPRQSGLCGGYCPVTECEYWHPRKERTSR